MKTINEQATNKVNIIGKLLDGTSFTGKLNDGREYESLKMTIRVHQTYGGKEEVSEIPVSQFATHYTSHNKLNPAWDNLQKTKELKTAQQVGIADAAMIMVPVRYGNIRENSYISRNTGSLINNWQISTSFINQSTFGNELATFNVDIFVMDMHDEVDRNGDPTGRLVIKGGLVQYGNTLDVLDFIVEDPEGVDFASRVISINDTVNVQGHIRVASREIEAAQTSDGWGASLPQTTTQTVRELIITWIPNQVYEEEFSYDPIEIRKAFQDRKARIEQLQQNAIKRSNTQEKTSDKFEWE